MSTPTVPPKFDGTSAGAIEHVRSIGLLPVVQPHLEVLRTLAKTHGLPFKVAVMVVALEAKEEMESHA